MKRHLGLLLVALAAAGLVGVLTGHLWEALAATAAGYLAWMLVNGLRLHAWLRRGAGEPPESLGLWADIFDRIHDLQRQDLQRQKRQRAVIEEFQRMSDALPDATLVIDGEDNVNWFNTASRDLLGLRAPGDVGKPITNLLRGPDFVDWLAVGDRVQGPFEMVSPIDSNIRLSVSAIRYGDGQRLLVLRDITDIHNLERVRRDFVANVSHELRTPLTVLLGYLEVMRDQAPEAFREPLERMQNQANQMQALLHDLLELSRLQSDAPEHEQQRVDMPELLMQLKEQCEELSQGRHDLRFEIEPGLGMSGNALDLESCFRNLVDNAIHYTPAGGRITVRWEQRDDGLVFSVADTGLGIPSRDIPRLTERFYRVGQDRSRNSGGTGLGLAIVKHVLNTHDGRLMVESELGAGSTFSCVFPAGRRSVATDHPD